MAEENKETNPAETGKETKQPGQPETASKNLKISKMTLDEIKDKLQKSEKEMKKEE